MTIFYHSLMSGLGYCEVSPGDRYKGSDRDYLSVLLEGKVGFAYPYLPDGWKDCYGIFELEIPANAVVFQAKDGHDVPRDVGEEWDKCCVCITAAEAVALAATNKNYHYEVAFNAKDVVFGKELRPLRPDLEALVGCFDALDSGLKKGAKILLQAGLGVVDFYWDAGYYGVRKGPRLNAVGITHGYFINDFDSLEEFLVNKPHILVDLLEMLRDGELLFDNRTMVSECALKKGGFLLPNEFRAVK